MQEQLVDTRCVLSWETAERKKCVKARLVAKGFQDPDSKNGLVETSGCVSLRSSHLQVIPLSATRNWKLWSLGIKNALSQAHGFERDVSLHAPLEWGPPCLKRAWEIKAPAYELNDAPAAFRRSLKRHILNSDLSVKNVGLRREASAFDPCIFFVFGTKSEQWVHSPLISTIFSAAESLMYYLRSGDFRNNVWRDEVAGEPVRACWRGLETIGQLLSLLYARGIRQEPPASGDLAGTMGGASEIALPGRCEIASVQTGGAVLAGNGLATGYLCETGSNCLAH